MTQSSVLEGLSLPWVPPPPHTHTYLPSHFSFAATPPPTPSCWSCWPVGRGWGGSAWGPQWPAGVCKSLQFLKPEILGQPRPSTQISYRMIPCPPMAPGFPLFHPEGILTCSSLPCLPRHLQPGLPTCGQLLRISLAPKLMPTPQTVTPAFAVWPQPLVLRGLYGSPD